MTLRAPGSLTSGEIDAVRLVGPERAGDEPRALRRSLTSSQASRASRAAGEVELVGEVLHAVVGLGDRGRGERVGLDDVGAGLEVLPVDRADHLGLGEVEQVAVALDVAVPVGEPLAAVTPPRRAGRPGSACPWRRRAPGSARAGSPPSASVASGRRSGCGDDVVDSGTGDPLVAAAVGRRSTSLGRRVHSVDGPSTCWPRSAMVPPGSGARRNPRRARD